MISIYRRHTQRDIANHSIVACIREDGHTCITESLFYITSDISVLQMLRMNELGVEGGREEELVEV